MSVFKSEKLSRITIGVPEQFISAATGVLASFRLLHLIRIDETHLGRLGYGAENDVTLVEGYQDLFKEIEGLLHSLGIHPDSPVLEDSVNPEKEIFQIRERIDQIKLEIAPGLSGLEIAASEFEEKKALLERFGLLPEDLDFSRLSRPAFVNWVIGLTPSSGLDKLEESLSEVHHALIELNKLEDRTLLIVFGLKRDWPIFERALKGALFDRLTIASDLSGKVAEILRGLQSEIVDLENKKKGLGAQQEIFRDRHGKELIRLRKRIVKIRQILAARRFFGKVDKSFLISGWIPEKRWPALQEALSRATEGQVILEKIDPEELREVRQGIIRIPILFNNPLLVRPFERLTGLYGTPHYREVEPTIFFALSFLLLFGLMFGDVGQGAVLFLIGYLIFRRVYRFIDYGTILMECGVSSMIFGFLYGSVFGLETVLPALWFRPLENIYYLVKVSLILGTVLVSLGLALNLVNAFRWKESEKLFSVSGLAGALLYWMSMGLVLKYLLTGKAAAGEWKLLVLVAAVLLTIMILHRPVYRLVVRKRAPGGTPKPADLMTELLESIVETFDDLLRFVANTLSFIRVAAFALSHAALFIAVFSIANVVSQGSGQGMTYWLVVALGNVIIILLEGLVVSIQVVRLEYYEFFGKFFRGGGEKFRPFGGDNGAATK
jgi:V/A-type H+-transporting ATPase subunit I